MPLTPPEFSQLMVPFAPFELPLTLAIAVSGGPDSLALALLAHEWAKNLGGKAIALTVDHQLREGSTAEAHQVKAWLKARGIEHHILTWKREAPLQTAIQATAREARYQILGEWCKDHDVRHLLTAHHAQDQLETFMIRLAKGSGLKGLTSTQKVVLTNFGRILRPLLTLDANRLKATLKQLNQPFIQDPSNENENFTRVRWRQLLPALSAEGVTPMALQETLERLNHAQRLLDQHILGLLRQHVLLSPHGYVTFNKEALKESPEAFEEMLKRILATIGTRSYPVRRQALHRAMEAMNAGQSFTLGGCQIIHKAKEFSIVREPAAAKEDIPVNNSGTYLWDHRFRVNVPEVVPCRIAALGKEGIQKLEAEARKNLEALPYLVLQTLPALWREEKFLGLSSAYTFTPNNSTLLLGL